MIKILFTLLIFSNTAALTMDENEIQSLSMSQKIVSTTTMQEWKNKVFTCANLPNGMIEPMRFFNVQKADNLWKDLFEAASHKENHVKFHGDAWYVTNSAYTPKQYTEGDQLYLVSIPKTELTEATARTKLPLQNFWGQFGYIPKEKKFLQTDNVSLFWVKFMKVEIIN